MRTQFLYLFFYSILILMIISILQVMNNNNITTAISPGFTYSEWKGHRYVILSGYKKLGLSHDPDCPRCNGGKDNAKD